MLQRSSAAAAGPLERFRRIASGKTGMLLALALVLVAILVAAALKGVPATQLLSLFVRGCCSAARWRSAPSG